MMALMPERPQTSGRSITRPAFADINAILMEFEIITNGCACMYVDAFSVLMSVIVRGFAENLCKKRCGTRARARAPLYPRAVPCCCHPLEWTPSLMLWVIVLRVEWQMGSRTTTVACGQSVLYIQSGVRVTRRRKQRC